MTQGWRGQASCSRFEGQFPGPRVFGIFSSGLLTCTPQCDNTASEESHTGDSVTVCHQHAQSLAVRAVLTFYGHCLLQSSQQLHLHTRRPGLGRVGRSPAPGPWTPHSYSSVGSVHQPSPPQARCVPQELGKRRSELGSRGSPWQCQESQRLLHLLLLEIGLSQSRGGEAALVRGPTVGE